MWIYTVTPPHPQGLQGKVICEHRLNHPELSLAPQVESKTDPTAGQIAARQMNSTTPAARNEQPGQFAPEKIMAILKGAQASF